MNQKGRERLDKELRKRLIAFGGIQTMRDMEALVKELVPFIAGECDTEYGKGWNNHLNFEDEEYAREAGIPPDQRMPKWRGCV